MAKRGEAWSPAETKALIAAWGDRKIQGKMDTQHRNAEVYAAIAEALLNAGFEGRDMKQCRTKVKHLKTEYKKFKDSLAKSGNSRKTPPPFFQELDNFLGDRPEATGLENAIDTSTRGTASTEHEADEENGDELYEKYGRGVMVEKECAQCGYKEMVHTAGAFVESGCTRVYAEEDEFNCPNCQLDDCIGGNGTLDASEASSTSTEFETAAQTPQKRKAMAKPPKKKVKAQKIGAMEKAMAAFLEYQKETDTKYLNHMREQVERDAALRMEEIKAQKESSELLARMLSFNAPQQLVYSVPREDPSGSQNISYANSQSYFQL